MGQILPPENVKLICGLLINDADLLPALFSRLEEAFGDIDYQSPRLPFDFTRYYAPEMGDSLQRMFISFSKLIVPDMLADIKRTTNDFEDEFCRTEADNQRRNINIDPGYMSPANFILASTKNYSHRVYLRDSIYAEIELIYSKKKFNAVPWTYPDYQSEEYHQILMEIRDLYMKQLRQPSMEMAYA